MTSWRIFLGGLAGVFALSAECGIAQEPAALQNREMSTAPPQIECTIPVLPVRDLARSIAFYTEKLGFRLDWGGEPDALVCSVSRDKRCIMLQRRDKIEAPVWVWIGVDAKLFDVFRGNGVKVFQEPKNHRWAYEMKFEDPDGNVLWLGSEPRADLPFEEDRK